MVELMSMEAPDNGRLRDDMIENFNEGYRVQQRFRPLCGPEVTAERRALAHRGQDLADMMREAYYD
jgi:predicted secreted protein